MPNIAMTNFCNMGCPYCFADEFIKREDKCCITEDQLIQILDFISTSEKPINRIGLIGGEPTLHPDIYKMVTIAKTYAQKNNSSIVIFSNGIELDRILPLIDRHCTVLINLNEPRVVGEEKWERLMINLNKIKALNLTQFITLGINLYPDIQDYEYIFKEAKKIYGKTIRCSFVAPTKNYSTTNRDEFYEKAKPIFLDFFKLSEKYNIRIQMDCNRIPECYFSEEELTFIKSRISYKDKEGLDHYCHPVVDITPNFEATSCFGTYKTVKLTDFETFDALEAYMEENIICPLREENTKEQKCQDCQRLKDQKCQGGCLAFAKNQSDILE